MKQDFDTADYLRMEIETPSEIQNLVQNPSGELGAWGWITPVDQTVLNSTTSGGSPALIVSSPNAQQYRTMTSKSDAIVGKYYQGRMNVAAYSSTGVYHRLFFEFYDIAGAVLSTTYSVSYVNTTGTKFYVSPVAPANTAYVAFGLAVSGNGAVNPPADSSVTFREVQMIETASNVTAQTRTNLVRNPSLETNLNGFAAQGAGNTVTRATDQAWKGTYSLKSAVSGASTLWVRGLLASAGGYGNQTLTTNKQYVLSFYARTNAARTLVVGTRLRSISGASTNFDRRFPLAANTWTRVSVSFNSGKYDVLDYIAMLCQTKGGSWWFDGFMLEQTSTLGEWFDGANPPAGWTSGWSGTAHASASSAQSPAAQFAYVPPIVYTDILGSANTISIQRNELEVGTLQANLKDTSLDPATADTIRPGRRVRLSALVDDVWEPIFLGKVSSAKVDYALLHKDEAKRANITLTAVDAVSELANTRRSNGVVLLGDLPAVLEGVNVPYDIKGAVDQVIQTAETAYVNDNASVLDIVAVARDTWLQEWGKPAYAWVSRKGILNVQEGDTGTGKVGNTTDQDFWDESDYLTDFAVDYDTDRCINEVVVKALRITGTGDTAQTEEWTFGPYRDEASIRQWGTHSQEFTVAVNPGVTLNDAYFSTYAANILAANANPEKKVNALTLGIFKAEDIDRNLTTLSSKVLVDLYDHVRVWNDEAGIEEKLLNIASIEHTITPKRWSIGVGFGSLGSVASPAIQPALRTTPVGVPMLDMQKNGTNFTLANATESLIIGWTINTNIAMGAVSGSSVVITQPGLYMVSFTATFPAGASGRRVVDIRKTSATGPILVRGGDVVTTTAVAIQAVHVVRLAADEVICGTVYQTSGASMSLPGTSYNQHFTVAKIGA